MVNKILYLISLSVVFFMFDYKHAEILQFVVWSNFSNVRSRYHQILDVAPGHFHGWSRYQQILILLSPSPLSSSPPPPPRPTALPLPPLHFALTVLLLFPIAPLALPPLPASPSPARTWIYLDPRWQEEGSEGWRRSNNWQRLPSSSIERHVSIQITHIAAPHSAPFLFLLLSSHFYFWYIMITYECGVECKKLQTIGWNDQNCQRFHKSKKDWSQTLFLRKLLETVLMHSLQECTPWSTSSQSVDVKTYLASTLSE